ncbi:hypothetical protein EH228_17540 [Erwinia endophytica]|uniref:hypothetical protein n=1 Tax=Erwinia endophytica TaxID=1563158 RepID=UPI001265F910|nr:hypothetical protein [Erwinia endophytica]KAB8306096.1 hypothetical protein EH228_17540 [Erwinia endophytica]
MKNGAEVAAIILLSILLLGCKPSNDQAITFGSRDLASTLKDPDSVKFRGVRFIEDIGTKPSYKSGYVCGELNAKNSYGAYVGFQPFYIHVFTKTRWIFPLLGVIYTTREMRIARDGSLI